MFWYFTKEYMYFLIAILGCMILSGIASAKVHKAYERNDRMWCRSGMTGYEAARRLLHAYGAADISLGKVKGKLSDHYHPGKEIVNLSESTYDSRSIAAVAVAAHEIGHVMQKKDGYGLYRLRTAIVPVANFGSYLAMPLVLVGILLDYFVQTANANTGFYIAMVGVILYGGSLLFALVTLPVELNASRRGLELLDRGGYIDYSNRSDAQKVLSAAAWTYILAALGSLLSFLRFFMLVNGNRRRN